MYAFTHNPLTKKQQNSQVSHLVINSFIRSFYGLKGLPNFFTKQMSHFFKTPIEQGFALVKIDNFLLLSNSKDHIIQLIEQLHILNTKNNLKLAPEKSPQNF